MRLLRNCGGLDYVGFRAFSGEALVWVVYPKPHGGIHGKRLAN